MPFEPIDLVDRVSEVSVRFDEAGRMTTPDVQENMSEVANQIEVELALLNPSFGFKMEALQGRGILSSFTLGAETKPIELVDSTGQTRDIGDAIKDSSVEPSKVGEAYASASEALGVYMSPGVEADIVQRTEANPTRAIDKANVRVKAKAAEFANDPELNTQTLKDADSTYDNESSTPDQKAKAAEIADSDLNNSKVKQELDDKIKRIQDAAAKDPNFWSKAGDLLEKSGAWLADKLPLILAGILGYELIKAYQNELKGCWQAGSDGKTVTKIKIQKLTCDSCCSDVGDTQPYPDTACDPKNPPTGVSCTCQTSCSGDDCMCGKTCDNESNPGLCSVWCSNSVRILSGVSDNTYSYACNNPSLTDTIADIATNVDDIIDNLINGAAGFFQTLLKWGGYILLAVAGILLIYFGFKFISGLSSGNQRTQPRPSTS